ncbi:HutD family protein [Streptomyces sp. NPDC051079]|uniref:HutD/Ves family protein n=1 Tax=Streptomyces sp. NPDC051079 TaxID=3155043 RepID=UPI00344E2C03
MDPTDHTARTAHTSPTGPTGRIDSFFDVETLTAGRWRNGGGATREIVVRPPDAEEFGWRASVADIDADGPFSAFPGVDRTLTLLAGEGVRLVCPGEFDRPLTRAGEPFSFSGDLALDAELAGGPCRVLNLMVRRGRWTARVERVSGPVLPGPGHAGLLYVLRGRWRTGADDDGGVLAPGQGVWWDGAEDGRGGGGPSEATAPRPLSPDAAALWADVAPAG